MSCPFFSDRPSRSAEIAELKELRPQIQELKNRYNMALDVIGEKEEQLEEMKADIGDMKMLYKTQINELLERVETLSKLSMEITSDHIFCGCLWKKLLQSC